VSLSFRDELSYFGNVLDSVPASGTVDESGEAVCSVVRIIDREKPSRRTGVVAQWQYSQATVLV